MACDKCNTKYCPKHDHIKGLGSDKKLYKKVILGMGILELLTIAYGIDGIKKFIENILKIAKELL